jgi:hypothetical protein
VTAVFQQTSQAGAAVSQHPAEIAPAPTDSRFEPAASPSDTPGLVPQLNEDSAGATRAQGPPMQETSNGLPVSRNAKAAQSPSVTVTLPAPNSQILSPQLQLPVLDRSQSQQGSSAAVPANPTSSAEPRANQDVRPVESEQAAAPPARTDAAGAASAKPEMAFAARVQPSGPAPDTATDSGRSSEPQLAAASASALRKASTSDTAGGPDTKDAVRTAEPPAALQPMTAAFGQTVQASETAAPPQGAPPQQAPRQPAEIATPQPDSQLKPAAPLKEDVRVMQQAGEVLVSVRTGDTELAHGLRQGLPELVGKLEDNGYRAEAWRPNGATASTSPGAQSQEPQSASGQSGAGSSDRQSGSQQNGGQQNQNQNAFNRPRWVEELETSLTESGESTGETYGIGN